MPRFLVVPIIALAQLAGCVSRESDWYPPPAQRHSSESSAGRIFLSPWVSMNDPNADAHIVRDVMAKAGDIPWRWTQRRPELRFYVERADKLNFVMEFAIAGQTFKDTGPVTLSVLVNGKLIGKHYCPKPVVDKLSLPVPAGLLKPGAINQVAIEPDKVWKTADGSALAFILVSAGFKE